MQNLLKSSIPGLMRNAKGKVLFQIRRLIRTKQQFDKFNKLLNASNGKASYVGSFKYIFRWRKSLAIGRAPLADHKPWIVYDAFKFLDQIVSNQMIVFEYGSGGSSAYFSEKVKKVLSVEHDKKWLEKTAEVVNNIGNNNWTGNLIGAVEDSFYDNKNFLVPTDYVSYLDFFKGKEFFNYASYIDRFDNEFFDIVLIDGRVRTSCFMHAKTKVKKKGYLILDNSERERYDSIHKELEDEGWLKFNFFGPGPYVDHEFWQTTLWQKIV